MIYLLFTLFLGLLIYVYKDTNGDIISPSFVYLLGYSISIFFAILNVDNWGINLHGNTFLIILIGTFIFLSVGKLIKKLNQFNNKEQHTSCIINYSKKKVEYFCLFQLVVIVIWTIYIFCCFCDEYTLKGFSEGMRRFRMYASYSNNHSGSYIFYILNQLTNNIVLSVYPFIYMLVNNYFYTKTYLTEKWLVCSIILSAIILLLKASRGEIVFWAIAVVMLFLLFYKLKFNNNYRLNCKKLLILVVACVVGAYIFYIIKSVVGRIGWEKGIIEYISLYVGGAIPAFDLFMQQGQVPSSQAFGQETFYALNKLFMRIGIIEEIPNYIIHLEFIDSATGIMIGNIYTSYRAYIKDFGIYGIFILPAVFSFVVNFVYYNIFRYRGKLLINYWIVIYTMIFHTIFFDFTRNLFFALMVSHSSLRIIIVIMIYFYFFIDKNSWERPNSQISD